MGAVRLLPPGRGRDKTQAPGKHGTGADLDKLEFPVLPGERSGQEHSTAIQAADTHGLRRIALYARFEYFVFLHVFHVLHDSTPDIIWQSDTFLLQRKSFSTYYSDIVK